MVSGAEADSAQHGAAVSFVHGLTDEDVEL